MNTFDYDTQVWVDGIVGTQVRLAQLREELELLIGPRGEEYLKFCAGKSYQGHSLLQAIQSCASFIAECEKALQLAGRSNT